MIQYFFQEINSFPQFFLGKADFFQKKEGEWGKNQKHSGKPLTFGAFFAIISVNQPRDRPNAGKENTSLQMEDGSCDRSCDQPPSDPNI